MDRITFIILIFQFGYCNSQQSVTLNLETREWNAARKEFYTHNLLPVQFITSPDSTIVLMNLDTISRYALFYIKVQGKTDIHNGSYLKIMTGYNKHNKFLIIPDKNNNGKYDDELVYTIDMNEPVTSELDFYKRLPLLMIDSIEVYNNQNKTEYKSLELKLGIRKLNGKYFENIKQLEEANNYYLVIYAIKYYSAIIKKGNYQYEVAVILNPVMKNIPDFPGIAQDGSIIIIYRKMYAKDTVISFMPLAVLNNRNSAFKNSFKLGKDFYKINHLSIQEKKLALTKLFKTDQQDRITIADKDHQGLSAILSDNSYTLLDFTGSWCKPCQVILPKLQLLYDIYYTKIKFISIAVENDLETARNYHEKTGIKWKMVYENLNCNDVECLKNKLNVNGFPTLILIDRNRKIVFHEAGVQAIDELEQLLQKLF